MVDLLFLHGPHKDAGLAGLLGEAVVDIRDYGEVGALWVTEAHIDPVISNRQHNAGIVLIPSHFSCFHIQTKQT